MIDAFAALTQRLGYSAATLGSLNLPDISTNFESQLKTAIAFSIAVGLDFLIRKIKGRL